MRIMVVDDNLNNRRVVEINLKRCRHEVILASNGQEAIVKLHEMSNIDLIITDICMPVVSGWELVRYARENPKTAGIPFIAVSGTQEITDSCPQWNEQDTFISKPYDCKDLINTVNRYLPT